MTARPLGARPRAEVELLERALGWTRGALVGTGDDEGGRPTPCAGWTIVDLLFHMVDSLEALTEASLGRVALAGPPPASGRPAVLADHLRVLGCALLGGWVGEDRRDAVVVGEGRLDATSALEVAALEVAVHGWDLARARGITTPFPPLLAAALLPVAVRTVPVDGRGDRFAPPVPPRSTDPAALLLAHLGRR